MREPENTREQTMLYRGTAHHLTNLVCLFGCEPTLSVPSKVADLQRRNQALSGSCIDVSALLIRSADSNLITLLHCRKQYFTDKFAIPLRCLYRLTECKTCKHHFLLASSPELLIHPKTTKQRVMDIRAPARPTHILLMYIVRKTA